MARLFELFPGYTAQSAIDYTASIPLYEIALTIY
jgi:hypothetical protein